MLIDILCTDHFISWSREVIYVGRLFIYVLYIREILLEYKKKMSEEKKKMLR